MASARFELANLGTKGSIYVTRLKILLAYKQQDCINKYNGNIIQCVPLATDPSISLIILTPMEIFNTFVNQLDDEELSIGYFHQDGVTSHSSYTSMAKIQSFFSNRVISKGLWPLGSPDLMPPDYFLWGYLKGRVTQNKPRTTDALKANTTEEIQAVTADILARTFQNMACQVQSCLDANGGHFQHTL